MDARVEENVRPDLLAYSGPYDSLARYISAKATARPARMCILTQDIFGPIRNAGVGTAFMYAAEILAKRGHDVTILFTQGRTSHSGPIEHWIEFYRERNIKFICAENKPTRAPTPALQWSYQGYRALLEFPPFDIVHSSECGASPYYALMAKRNLGQFRETIFATKVSSPHLWNRQGNETALNLDTGLIICAAERYCVEQTDFVIAPTQHMLDWMTRHGYRLPRHVCVQPNPVPLPADIGDAWQKTGEVQRIKELVFFGRLEPRKGILVFAEALELLYREGRSKCRVVFLGKKNDEFNFDEFLAGLQAKLPFEFRAIHNYDAAQAVAFLREGGRLAVIPSLIDQAALTAYESMLHGIPFIAAETGGIPEIIHPEDRARVLFLPRAQALHRLLERCLKSGAAPARLSFDPRENFDVWDEFHQQPNREILLGDRQEAAALSGEESGAAEVQFGADAPYPLHVDELLEKAEQATSTYIILYSNLLRLEDGEKADLVATAARGGFDVAVPASTTKDKPPETFVNFEPSRWTKLEFSRIDVPILVIKREVLITILKYLRINTAVYFTNLDTIIAVACQQENSVRILPMPYGQFAGPTARRITRRQRARQLEHLVVGLPPDLGNLFRIYGGLLDERARVLSVQPVLRNLQRLLRVLGKLEALSDATSGSDAAKSRKRRLNIPWRGWRGDSVLWQGRVKSIGNWLNALIRRGGRDGGSGKSED